MNNNFEQISGYGQHAAIGQQNVCINRSPLIQVLQPTLALYPNKT